MENNLRYISAKLYYSKTAVQSDIVKLHYSKTAVQNDIVKLHYSKTAVQNNIVKLHYSKMAVQNDIVKFNTDGILRKSKRSGRPHKITFSFARRHRHWTLAQWKKVLFVKCLVRHAVLWGKRAHSNAQRNT